MNPDRLTVDGYYAIIRTAPADEKTTATSEANDLARLTLFERSIRATPPPK